MFRKLEFSDDGWLVAGSPPSFEPGTGRLVAHDILEHKLNERGTFEEELMALGRAIYVRLPYASMHDIQDTSIGIDIEEFYRERLVNNESLDLQNTKLVQVDEFATDAISAVFSYLEENRYRNDIPAEWRTIALKWMRRGYLDAMRRYKLHDQYEVSLMFKTLAGAFGVLWRGNGTFSLLAEECGTGRYNLTVNFQRGSARLAPEFAPQIVEYI